MQQVLLVINILLSIAIVVFVLMQGKGGGLGSAWGGGGEQFQTRRGVEKLTLRLTVVCIVLFLIVSIVSFFVL